MENGGNFAAPVYKYAAEPKVRSRFERRALTSGDTRIDFTQLNYSQTIIFVLLLPIVLALTVGMWIVGVSRVKHVIRINVSAFGIRIQISTSAKECAEDPAESQQ